jgi:hypothetical protein
MEVDVAGAPVVAAATAAEPEVIKKGKLEETPEEPAKKEPAKKEGKK